MIPSADVFDLVALDAQHWFASFPEEVHSTPGLHETTDAGRTWTALAPTGLVSNASVGPLEFVDSLHAWARVDGSSPGRTDLNITLQLYATDDGARSWRLLAPGGRPAPRAAPCTADNVVLGPAPGVATPRFNVFAFNFDPSAPVTITFDTPVVAYPGTPGGTSGPITSYAILAEADAKFTFRTSDSGLTGVGVRIAGAGCAASTVVDLTVGATSAP